MPVKIRLQRHGKKGKPFYWIVAADSRSKRDGKSLEKLGTYNPNTNPATIDLNIDNAVKWLQNGAQPTDTARTILSYKGALLKNHLAGGIKKDKAKRVNAKVDGLSKADAEVKAKALEAEKEANQARIAKNAPAPVVAEVEATPEAAAEEAPQTIDEVAAEAQAPAAKKVEEAEASKEEE
ncbi:UNVERIFIED_CONTAM: hypothetical protein GTU68_034348 [Idotea baltica]|nr:hypothetical protein [Idotea baltica]